MKKRNNYESLLLRVLSVIAFLVIWQVLTVNNIKFILNFGNLPTPLEVLALFIKEAGTSEFFSYILSSVLRVFIGVIMALILAVPLGVLTGMNRKFEDLMFPLIELLRPVPNIAWAPIAILIFPTVNQSILFITFIGAFFPILLSVIAGVRSIPKKYPQVGIIFKLDFAGRLKHIILPAILPSILTGLKIGIGVSWMGVIVAEMIGGQDGIGYYTWLGFQLVNFTQIVVGIMTIGLLGILSSRLVELIEYFTLRWKRKTDAY